MPDDRFTSKLSSECQTVIPHAIRERLGLRPGDTVRYVVREGEVVLERATAEGGASAGIEDDPFTAFVEWGREADERAYADL